ncbi:MAG: hypothetical protein ACKPKO_01255 [Candidatus Fonsibacter sp.]
MSKSTLTRDYTIYLFDLFVGLPYEPVSSDGELNYRLRAMYNKTTLCLNKF